MTVLIDFFLFQKNLPCQIIFFGITKLRAVVATGLIEALMGLTLLLLKRVKLDDELGSLVNFAEPVPRVWIAAAAAFVAAVIASVITLHRINKESLTDQMRTVE